MPNILDIRRRIRSVINTRQITKAMKMVSAAKLRRAQERALAARPYAQMLTNVLKSLVARAEIYDPETGEPKHPLLAQRPEKNILLIVVTGDKGLAGAFNANITKVEFAQASALATNVIARYQREEIDAVYVVFNEFKSVIAQRLIVEQILPIEQIGEQAVRLAEEPTEEEKKKAKEAAVSAGVGMHATEGEGEAGTQFGTSQVDYIYEQAPEDLFRSLLPKYVSIQIFRALLESVAAEHAARMTAMDSATNNANDMIDSLTLTMNRVRQAKITKEIIEIVSGAAAM
jgi:F-type H+-transporting ATPase subunit gamma